MLEPPAMRTLGLDVGTKTIGVALSDEGGSIATAREVLSRRGHEADAKAVVERVTREGVRAVVVGLPLELNGREGHRARLVRRFVAVLEPQLAVVAGGLVPVRTWDERFSTAAAERTLLEADVSRAGRKRKVDALAAQFILQGWLDAQTREAEADDAPADEADAADDAVQESAG